MKTKVNIDKLVLGLIGAVLLYSIIILIQAKFSGEHIGDWIWNRHQNQFSWYSRPLFIVPACYYAYRKKLWHIIGFMLLLFASLFWFPSPDLVSESVANYLEWEKELFLTNDSSLPLILLSLAVLGFLFALFYAFWKRNPWYGLLLVNVGTIIKIIVSIGFGKEVGMAAIVPSISSIGIINIVAFIFWKYKKRKKSTHVS